MIGILTLACAIAKLPFRWKEIVPLGIFLGMIVYLIRSLQIPFGAHTLAVILIIFLYLYYKGKEVTLSLVTPLTCIIAVAVFEMFFITILAKTFYTTQEVIFANPWKRILFTEPQVIMLFITAFIIRRKREIHD